jgi:hypothetical protein
MPTFLSLERYCEIGDYIDYDPPLLTVANPFLPKTLSEDL